MSLQYLKKKKYVVHSCVTCMWPVRNPVFCEFESKLVVIFFFSYCVQNLLMNAVTPLYSKLSKLFDRSNKIY